MKNVFVVNEPLKRNERNEFGRAIDLRPAERFGNLIFMSEAGEPPLDQSAWVPRMRELAGQFQSGDYLLPVGHPVLIVAAAAMIGAFNTEPNGALAINILKWHAKDRTYISVPLDVFTAFPEQP